MPRREYLLNTFGSRIPITGLRVAVYARLGVRFADPGSTNIMMESDVHAPRGIEIGERCIVGRHCLLDGRGGIRLGDDVNISSYSRLITASHNPDSPSFAGYEKPIHVGSSCWIAMGVTVLPGVTIGAGAVVAAGAVVTSDVAPYTVMAGIPARQVSTRRRDLSYCLGHRVNWL